MKRHYVFYCYCYHELATYYHYYFKHLKHLSAKGHCINYFFVLSRGLETFSTNYEIRDSYGKQEINCNSHYSLLWKKMHTEKELKSRRFTLTHNWTVCDLVRKVWWPEHKDDVPRLYQNKGVWIDIYRCYDHFVTFI